MYDSAAVYQTTTVGILNPCTLGVPSGRRRSSDMTRRFFLPVILLGLAVAYPAAQATQERIDTDVNARIRKEGWDNSQIMRTMHFLTDVYGPRVTGSPNHEAAAKWV